MRQYEASAKTVEEAVELGLKELGVSIGDVEWKIVEEGSKGLFGLFGSRPVRVLLTVKEAEEDPLGDLLEENGKQAKKNEKKQDRKPEKKSAEKKEAEKKPVEKKEKAEKLAKAAKPEAEKKPAEEPTEKAEPRTLEKPEVTMIPDDQLEADSPAGTAKSFLTELTKLMGVDVNIDMGTDADGNVYGFINGDTLGILIGRRGETLDALQYLTSLKVNRGKDTYTRVTLDTENYRAKREDTLIRLANRMANRALRTGRKVSLEPMNPYERRIIHFALQQNEGVTTHSEGDEPNRHVVITHKK